MDELDEAEHEPAGHAEPSREEPRWRAHARASAIVFLALGLVMDLALEVTRPAHVLGSIAVVLAVSLRTPFGVAALAIDVLLELLDAVAAQARGAALTAAGHASAALGLAALALVLYRGSRDEGFERRSTLLGATALTLGLAAMLASLVRP